MCKAHKYQWKWVLILFIQESNNMLTLFSFSNSTKMKTGQKSGALCSDNRSRLWPWNPADNLELGFFPPYFLTTIPTLSHCFWSQRRLPPWQSSYVNTKKFYSKLYIDVYRYRYIHIHTHRDTNWVKQYYPP